MLPDGILQYKRLKSPRHKRKSDRLGLALRQTMIAAARQHQHSRTTDKISKAGRVRLWIAMQAHPAVPRQILRQQLHGRYPASLFYFNRIAYFYKKSNWQAVFQENIVKADFSRFER